MKAVLRGKYIASDAYITKEERPKINKVSTFGHQRQKTNLSRKQTEEKE